MITEDLVGRIKGVRKDKKVELAKEQAEQELSDIKIG